MDWVSSKSVFLILYVSLSLSRLSYQIPRPRPLCVGCFLLTDSACLNQRLLRGDTEPRDVFIEKLRRHSSSNLTVAMWKCQTRRIWNVDSRGALRRDALRDVEPLPPSTRKLYQTAILISEKEDERLFDTFYIRRKRCYVRIVLLLHRTVTIYRIAAVCRKLWNVH